MDPEYPEKSLMIRAFAISAGQNHPNTQKYKSDATGAFIPGAQKFATAYGCSWKTFNNIGTTDEVRRRFLKTIDDSCPGGTNLFAYFGHGTKDGLVSAECFTSQVETLLGVLKPKLSTPCAIVLYACSAGIAGGFTGSLREKFGEAVYVYGHTTAKHAFKNPDVSVECTSASPTFRLLYAPGSDLRNEWAEALEWSDLWLRFPLMSDEEIAGELYARRLMGTWEVLFGGGALWNYQFTWAPASWKIDVGRPYMPTPAGTVIATKQGKVGDKGSWYITTALVMKWESGKSETWPLPLHIIGQQGESEGYPLKARRLSRPKKLGILQG